MVGLFSLPQQVFFFLNHIQYTHDFTYKYLSGCPSRNNFNKKEPEKSDGATTMSCGATRENMDLTKSVLCKSASLGNSCKGSSLCNAYMVFFFKRFFLSFNEQLDFF